MNIYKKMKNHKLFVVAIFLAVIGISIQLQTSVTAQTVYASCPPVDAGQYQPVKQNCIYTNYITPGIDFLSVGVGVVVLAMIIIGAIQYSASSGNPQALASAKKRIINAIIALLLYALLFAFLNFLIPGGLL